MNHQHNDHYNITLDNGQPLKPDWSPTILMNLNDHCLVKIFSCLSLQGLCTVSEVCKRFQQLAILAFKSTWKNQMVSLYSINDIERSNSLRILCHFGDILEKVEVATKQVKFFNLIADKCGTHLTEVKFTSINSCERILNKENLAKFPNLRSLQFGGDVYFAIDYECIEQKFLKLERYSIDYIPFHFKNLFKFITLNPQLKHLGLTNHGQFPFDRDVMHFIDQNLEQLEELELEIINEMQDHTWFGGFDYQPLFFKNLKLLIFKNSNQTENWLRYLSISNKNMEEMHFYVDHSHNRHNFINLICSQYKGLKKLKFNFFLDEQVLMTLGKVLPKLSEIECHFVGYSVDGSHKLNNGNQLVQCIPRFIRQSKQLTSIVLSPFTGAICFVEDINPDLWTVTVSNETLKIRRSD